MRSLRSTTALLALLVTVWSNLAALPCSTPPVAEGEAHEHGAHHGSQGTAEGQGGHHHHGNPGTTAGGGGEDESSAGHDGQECAVLMSCGAVHRARSTELVHAILAPPVAVGPFAPLVEPSAADRAQDPPPPRRHA